MSVDERVRDIETQLAAATAERVAIQADADKQRRQADFAEAELARYQAMSLRTGGSSSSSDLGQLLLDATQERDTLLTEAQGLRAEVARLLAVETELRGELAPTKDGAQAAEMARLREELAAVRSEAYAMSRELATERATVTRLQANIIQLERRRPRSSAMASGCPSEGSMEDRF